MSDTLSRLQAALGDRYRIEREIGEGGMATVYLATDLRHERGVALKVLKPELAATMGPGRFLQEVRVTANLQHPHILPLFDSGEADGFLYYVMPYLEGESLRERLAREGELPVAEAVRILKEVVDALAAAHALGVVHRDIKPDNVMLSGRHAVVTDFGVAKAVSEATARHRLTTMGVALGTPTYMAPEQAAAEPNIDHRADLYAVGAMGYELLAGRPPFGGGTARQVLAAQVTEAPRPLADHRPSVPPGLGAVIMRCLEKKPADRWQSAEELLAQLEAFATPTAGLTPAGSMPTTPVSPGRRAGAGGWKRAAVPIGLALVAATAWLWTHRGPTENGTAESGAAAAGPAAVEAERLVVLPLRNLTADPELDVWGQLAADQMARVVDRARPVPVVPSTTVNDAIRKLGTGATTEAVAVEVEATHAFAGTVARTGGRLRFEVELLDVRTGERLRGLDPVTGPEASADSLVAALAQGVAVAAVAHLDPEAPLPTAQLSIPVSLAAFRDYLEQGELFCRGDYPGSIAAAERALEKSPLYVPSLHAMMTAYSNLGRGAEADSLIDVLEGIRDRMTAHEEASLDWMIGNRSDDPGLQERAAEQMFRIDPSGASAGGAMLTAYRQRRMEDAVERLGRVDLDGPCPWLGIWTQGSVPFHALGRYDEELALARHGLGLRPTNGALMRIEIRALAGLGRVEAVDSVLDAMERLPPPDDPHGPLVYAARELRAHGLEDAAEPLFRRALDGYASEPPDTLRAARAWAFYNAGRWEDADTLFANLLAEDPSDLDLLARRGVTLARLGRRGEALNISDRLGEVTGRYLQGRHIRGQVMIAAALGDRDEAVRLLQLGWRRGLRYNDALHKEPAFDGMWGHAPWDALMAPRE